MSKLPPSLDPFALLRQRWPDDTTLGQIKRLFELGNEAEALRDLTRGVVQIRFVTMPEEAELPDEMTLAEFRSMANAEPPRAKIAIDDRGDGGVPVRPRTPELVR